MNKVFELPVKQFVLVSEDEDIEELGCVDFETAIKRLEIAEEREPGKAWSLLAEIDHSLIKTIDCRDTALDRQYRAGFMAGWNAGVSGDEKQLKAVGNRMTADL